MRYVPDRATMAGFSFSWCRHGRQVPCHGRHGSARHCTVKSGGPYGLGGERDATNATCTKLRWDGMVMIRWIGVCASAYSTGTFFVNTNDGSGGSNVQIHGPSLLSESIAPCTLPITRNLRARKDAVTRNLPILLLSIVILAFLPSSWLLLMAGPSISPSKIQMGVQVAQKRGKANSQLTYRISCEMNSGCIAATGARKHLFLRRYGQSSLCERR